MRKFNDLLNESIKDTLEQVLGKSTAELIQQFMNKNHSLPEEDLEGRCQTLLEYLSKLLDFEQYIIIHQTGLKFLYSKLRKEYSQVEKHLSILDDLYEAKLTLLDSFLKQDTSPERN